MSSLSYSSSLFANTVVATLEPIRPFPSFHPTSLDHDHHEPNNASNNNNTTGDDDDDEKEILMYGTVRRPIVLYRQPCPTTIVLGRNPTTGIACPHVASQVATLRYQPMTTTTTASPTTNTNNNNNDSTTTSTSDVTTTDFQLTIKCHSKDCSVVVVQGNDDDDDDDGRSRRTVSQQGPFSQRPLHHGDIIRLYKHQYAYRVHIPSSTTATTTRTTATTTTSTDTRVTTSTTLDNNTNDDDDDDRHQNWKLDTAEECMCSICMEIMVETTSLVPCGHVLCRECCPQQDQQQQQQQERCCPTCRVPIQSTLANRAMDNVITQLVESPCVTIFHTTDVDHYWKRVKPTSTTPRTMTASTASPPKRPRRTRSTAARTTTTTNPPSVVINLADTTAANNNRNGPVVPNAAAAAATGPPPPAAAAVVSVDLAASHADGTWEAPICID